MDILSLLIVICTIIISFIAVYVLLKKNLNSGQDATLVEWLKSMQVSLEQTNKTLNDTMRGSTNDVAKLMQLQNREINQRLDTASRVIGDLQKHVGELSEVGRGIRDLQEFLQSPKLRGNIGEQVLGDMISQTFPKNTYHLQYTFRSGVKVDAAIKTDAGLLCIDSKFPLENYAKSYTAETASERGAAKKQFMQDVKKHVGDISKKYILPEEGTMDFALMYIPSESVYYEIINETELIDFSRRQHIYPVSPNTLYAHLQVILLSFQGKELEKRSREIMKMLNAMQADYDKLYEQTGVLSKHVNNAYNTMNAVAVTVNQVGLKLSTTRQLPVADES